MGRYSRKASGRRFGPIGTVSAVKRPRLTGPHLKNQGKWRKISSVDREAVNIEELAESLVAEVVAAARPRGLEPMSAMAIESIRRAVVSRPRMTELLRALLRQGLEAALFGDLVLSLDVEPAPEPAFMTLHATVSARGEEPRGCAAEVAFPGAAFGVEALWGRGFVLWTRVKVERPTEFMAVPRFPGRRVLVVDASPGHREVMRRKLGFWGIATVGVDNAYEAARRLDQEAYDAAFVDKLTFHGAGAPQLRETLRGRPLAVMSLFPASLEEALAQPDRSAFLAKPIRQAELFACLSAFFGSPAAPLPSFSAGAPPAAPPVSAPVPAPAPAAEPAPVAADAPGASNRRIVVCDDDESIAEILRAAFTKAGFTVDVAPNGQEGLKLIRAKRPSIVFLDIDMPVMSGLEVLQDLYGNPLPAPIPYVIIFSNFDSQKIRNRCKSLGAREIMMKQPPTKELLAHLEELVLSQDALRR